MKLKFLTLLLTVSVVLTGCKDVQIFVEKEEPGAKKITAESMEPDKYYVKNGTKFQETMEMTASAHGLSAMVNESRVMYTTPETEEYIPTHYKNEIIAYASANAKIDSVTLERFQDLGYSFGLYNGIYDPSEGSITFLNAKGSAVPDSDASLKLENIESPDIKIVEINGNPITEEDISTGAGVFLNLEYGQEYTIAYYSGTYYHEDTFIPDTHMYSSYEIMNYDSSYISITKNGYTAFNTPTDLKSGYYCINGQGFFKYYSHERGEGDDNEDMNVAYYLSEEDKIAAYSRQYVVDVPSLTKDMSIEVQYDSKKDLNGNYIGNETETELNSLFTTSQIKAFVYSPDKKQYIMSRDDEKNKLILNLTEAIPGKWTINIIPNTLNILSVDVNSTQTDRERTQETYSLTLSENRTNVAFKSYYTVDVESDYNELPIEEQLNAVMVAPDGQTYTMTFENEDDPITKEKKNILIYRMNFAPAGEYSFRINHYPTRTTVSGPQIVDNTESAVDVITVEE